MRNWLWMNGIGLACVALAGCASQPAPLSADDAMVLLRSGRPLLTCRDACLAAWRQSQPQAEHLAAAGEWRDLAVLVERVGYQDDLSFYYLGRAAEGLDYRIAAASFYRQSLQLSGTPASCANSSKQCGGIALPHEASLRLAAIDRSLNPRPTGPHPARSVPVTPGAPVTEAPLPPAEAAAPAPMSPSAEVAAPMVTSPSARPTPQSAPGDTMDYIEPPPASR
jgi:hypothetical protein